jgi:hypothetical protein
MTQLEEIFIGWKNFVFRSPEHEAKSKERMKICVECPAFKSNQKCGECGCYMPAKTRNENSKCPIDKW